MGRRSRRDQRDDTPITSANLLSALSDPLPRPNRIVRVLEPARSVWSEVEDRRFFEPEVPATPLSFRAPRLLSGLDAAVVPKSTPARPFKPPVDLGKFQFADPLNVMICKRRHERREVWFAKKLKRRGGGGGKRNLWSEVECK
jgi:hypothetical protein